MQVSGDGNVGYVTSAEVKGKDGNVYYSCTMLDEEGNTLRVFCDAVMYGKLSALKLGDMMTPVFRLWQGRSGMGVSLVDFVIASHA